MSSTISLMSRSVATVDRGLTLLGVTWALTVIALLLVITRMFTSSKTRGEMRWDFLWVTVAALLGLGYQISVTLAVHWGLGSHIATLTNANVINALRSIWVSIVFCSLSNAVAKLAVCVLLLAVQGPAHQKKSYLLHVVWITNLLTWAVSTTVTFLQCSPVEKLWDNSIPGNCNLLPVAIKLGTFIGVWNSLSDAVLALYPAFIVWNLQASIKMKIGFCLLMSGGLVAAICGAVRTYMTATLKTSDTTYGFAPFITAAGVETWIIIIITSIPPLRAVFVRWFRKSTSQLSNSKNTGTATATNNGTQNLQTVKSRTTYMDRQGNVDEYHNELTDRKHGSEEDIVQPFGAKDIMVSTVFAIDTTERASYETERKRQDADLEQGHL